MILAMDDLKMKILPVVRLEKLNTTWVQLSYTKNQTSCIGNRHTRLPGAGKFYSQTVHQN